MRFCLVAIGSRGDVAPVVTVGVRLARRGHEVRVVTLGDYAGLVDAAGLEPWPVAADSVAAMWPDAPWLRRAALAQPGLMYALMRRRFGRAGGAIADAVLAAGSDADLVVAGTATRGAVGALAAARGRPFATLLLAPLLPAGRPASGVLVPPWGGPVLGRSVSTAMWAMTAGLGSGPGRAMRRRLSAGAGAPAGQPGAGSSGTSGSPGTPGPTRSTAQETFLVAASPLVSPPDPGAPWPGVPGAVERTGWIAPDTTPEPPSDPGLSAFLDRHPDAVAMSFGSCPSADPDADVRLFLAAAERTGRPVVLQTAARPSGPLGATVHNAPGTDHRWLFPRVRGVVHHGGAGTTMAALAAGRPAVVVPHLGDQPYYARRVRDLGVGVDAGPRWRLTAPGLAAALDRALRPGTVERARRLGAHVAAEDGAGVVADALERLAQG